MEHSRIDLADFVGERLVRRGSRRLTLQDDCLGLVEDTYASPNDPAPCGAEERYQIALPYHGVFAYNVGSSRSLVDTNGLLLISPGWDFQDEHPVAELGHGALLITPTDAVLHEICRGKSGIAAAFRSRTRRSGAELALLANLVRRRSIVADPLQRDELLIGLVRQVLLSPATQAGGGAPAVRRAKELLHSRIGERLTLSEIAEEVGVSPVYLTQEFTRSDGIPLYQYQLRLRLGRALAELPDCDSITGLALDLGFCSHSHFTSTFKSNFGLTPSEYRNSGGRRIHPLIAA